MTDTDKMPWGKHVGKPMQEVPASYLLYLHENMKDFKGEVADYIKENLETIKKQVVNERRYK